MSISLEYLENVNNSEKNDKVDLDTSLKIKDKFDPKFEADMGTIKSMGYDEKMIRKVYIFLKPNDIN